MTRRPSPWPAVRATARRAARWATTAAGGSAWPRRGHAGSQGTTPTAGWPAPSLVGSSVGSSVGASVGASVGPSVGPPVEVLASAPAGSAPMRSRAPATHDAGCPVAPLRPAPLRPAPRRRLSGRPHRTSPRARHRGGIALPVVLTVAVVLLLIAGLVHGRLLTAQRLAANRVHATVAAEAAETGIAWALARLNRGVPVDDACRPTTPGGGAAGRSFALRLAGSPAADGRWAPPRVRAGCAQVDGHWVCGCPLPAHGGAGSDTASFTLGLGPATPDDLLLLTVDGCSGAAAACGTPAARPDATARVAVTVARRPALHHAPAAALTVGGRLALGGAPWSLAAPRAPALALHTGGTVSGTRLDVTGPGGAPRSSVQSVADPALADVPAAHRFAQQFQLSPKHWQTLPGVRRIACHAPCDAALAQALATHDAAPMVWLQGGLRLAAPAQLGSATHPVLLVADGPVALAAATSLHGLLHVRGDTWHSHAGATVQGAVVAEGDLTGTGSARVRHDPAVLDALRAQAASFLRVPGSWRDFE